MLHGWSRSVSQQSFIEATWCLCCTTLQLYSSLRSLCNTPKPICQHQLVAAAACGAPSARCMHLAAGNTPTPSADMNALPRRGCRLRRARRPLRRVSGRVIHPFRQVRLWWPAPAARLVGLLSEFAHAALLHCLARQRARLAGLPVPRVLRHSCAGNTKQSCYCCIDRHRCKQAITTNSSVSH